MSEFLISPAALAGVFGLLIGSFLNVCIYRLPYRLSVVSPRSFCPECEHRISWYDNIPVVSYVFLHGSCRNCRNPIPIRYPVVEISTAILFYAVVLKFSITLQALKWLVFVCLMLVLFWTDIETRLLPDALTLGGIAAALVFSLFVPVGGFGNLLAPTLSPPAVSLLNAAIAAALLSLPLAAFASFYTRVRGLVPPGEGDFKLLGTMGAFLGLGNGLFAMMAGSVAGVVLGFSYIVVRRKDPRSTLLPFGTFLAGGGVVSLFWGEKILSWWLNFGR